MKFIDCTMEDFAEQLQTTLNNATNEFNQKKNSKYVAPSVDEYTVEQALSLFRQSFRQRLHTQTFQKDQRKLNKAMQDRLKDLGIDVATMSPDEITAKLTAAAANKAQSAE